MNNHIIGGFRISTANDSLFPNPEEIRQKKNIILKYLLVTPDVARTILEKCNVRNRHVRTEWISQLATMMKDGRWDQSAPTIVPFAVSDKGGDAYILLDKQHTLQGIVKSGIGQWLLLGFGYPVKSMDCIDQNHKRTLGDVFQLTGHTMKNKFVKLGCWFGSGCQAAWIGALESESRLQVSEVKDFIDDPCIRPSIEFIFGNVFVRNTKRITMAPVLGAIIRAHARWDLYKSIFDSKQDFDNRLIRFGEILTQGSVENYKASTESSAPKLRGVLENKYANKSMGCHERREVYLLTYKALDAFLNYKGIERLTLSEKDQAMDEPYPIAQLTKFKSAIPVCRGDIVKPIAAQTDSNIKS